MNASTPPEFLSPRDVGIEAPLRLPGQPLAVVIGSGFGGLAAAIRLSARGYAVQVLEKLDAPGGRAYVHRQDGFTFDAGPTIITAPFLFEELWALCGRSFKDDIDLRPMHPFYRIRFHDGTHFDYSGDVDAMLEEIARFEPGDVAAYLRFFAYAQRCLKLGFEGLGAVAFDSMGDLLRAIPAFARMGAWRSIHSVVASYFQNEKIRTVMSFHPLLIGGNPFSVTSAYALINALERDGGVHSAMGGTGAIVRAMVRLLAERGVPVRCNAPVVKIRVEGRRAIGVELANGEFMAADIVVSNADSAWTYKHLIAPRHRRVWTDRKIDRGRYSMGLFVWYFGTARQYPEVPHHMMLLGPRYKELLTDIFKRHKLAEDFSLYLHRPPPPTPRWRLPGATPFTRWRRCPTWTAAPTGLCRPSPTARPLPLCSKPPCCPACAARS